MLNHLNVPPTKPRRVVVIGAGGFIGSAVKRRLEADGVSVLGLTRKEVDLLGNNANQQLKNFLALGDSVVMVSAIAPVKTVTMLMQNMQMAQAVCEVLAETEIAHLIYISSDAVYADYANPVTEESCCEPSTLHGMMHAARELMLKSSTSAPFAALRPTLVYGSADPHGGYGPNRFRRQAEQNGAISIFGEGEEQRDHVAVTDVAAITALTLQHRSAGALNVVTGVSTSFHDIAHLIAKQYGAKVVSQPRPGPPPHLTHRFFDITDCLKAFPSFQYIKLDDGLGWAKQGTV